MADNVIANAGAGGATFASDDILGIQYPRTKIVVGADGSNDGDVSSANPMPISDAGGSLTVDGTVAVTNAGLTELAAAINASSQMDVNIATSVAIAVTDNAGSLTVDGTVTANLAAGTNNIGDVDVLTVPAPLNVVGTGTEATALRVTIASDSTGVLSVDDNGGSITVDGTFWQATQPVSMTSTTITGDVAVTNAGLTELAAAINASSQVDVNIAASGATVPVSLASTTITGTVAVTQSGTWDEVGINDSGNSITVDAPVGTPAFVRLSDGAAAITTLPVSLASVPSHAVTNAGTFAVQVDGSALTALQLIDDSIFTDDAAFTPATSKVTVAGYQADETATDSVDEGDAGAARMTLDRKQIHNPQPHTAGGCTIFKTLDLDETEEEVKASAGQIYGWSITNFATAVRHIKFYDATAANTTVGTTTPVMTISVPGNATDDTQSVFNLGGMGIPFATALSVAATTGLADNDTGAPGANDVSLMLFYK